MVLHFLERLLGVSSNPKKELLSDKVKVHLMESGFSEEEASELSWFVRRGNRGRWAGLLGGITLLYLWRPFFRRISHSVPFYRYLWRVRFGVQIAFVYGCYRLGDYWSTSYRRHANSDIPNILVSNLDYIESKQKFLQNFHVLNRKFTVPELQQFQFNQGTYENDGRIRKYIYNKYVHGGDETAWRAHFTRLQRGGFPYNDWGWISSVKSENAEKVANGEEVITKPYNLLDHFDRTGAKQGVRKLPIFKGWRALE